MKKRVGILTYHCIPNFGAQLQALSTIGYLKQSGIEPIMLNWYPEDLKEYYNLRVPKKQNEIQFDFSQNHMPVSRICTDLESLVNEIVDLKLDGIFIGSDALFDYTPEVRRYNFSFRKMSKIPLEITSNHKLPNPFWTSFLDLMPYSIPVMGYAISSQNTPYGLLNAKEKKELHRLLGNFSYLTVRDEWTKMMVEKIGCLSDIEIVPDPVFAFNQNYTEIPAKEAILAKYNLPDEYFLISFIHDYISDEFVNQIIRRLEHKKGLACVSFPMPDKLKKYDTLHTIELPLDPIDWYALIKYSKGYIGERMHPILVCLHNQVPFFCFDQYGSTKTIIPRIWKRFIPESSKIYDILRRAGLEGNTCFYNDWSGLTPDEIVDKVLDFPTEKSKAFADLQMKNYNQAMRQLLTRFLKQ